MNPVPLLQRLVRSQQPGRALKIPSCVFPLRREGFQHVAVTDGRVLVAVRHDGQIPGPDPENTPLVQRLQATIEKDFYNQESLYGWMDMQALTSLAGLPSFQPRALKKAMEDPRTKFLQFDDTTFFRATVARALTCWRGDRARFGVVYPLDEDDETLPYRPRVLRGASGFVYMMPCFYEPQEDDVVIRLSADVLRYDE